MAVSFRPVFILLTGRAVGLLATFLIPVVLARRLDLAAFGTYKQVFLLFATAWAIAQIGMAECLYYFIPRTPRQRGSLVANAMVALALSGLICAAVLGGARTQIASLFGNPSLATHLPQLGIFLLTMLIAAVLEITLISTKRFAAAAAAYVTFDLLRAACLVIPALFVASVEAVMVGAVAFGVVRCTFTLLFVLRQGARPSATLLREQWRYAAPFATAVVLETVTLYLHQYAVANRFDAATFAVYSVACLQIPLVGYAVSAAADVLMVRMALPAQRGDHAGALSDLHDTTRKLALLLFPLVALIWAVGEELIVLLFTSTYAASVPLFRVGALLILVRVVPTDAVLRVYAKTRTLMALNALHLVLVVATIGLAIDALGLMGAMIVAVAGLAVAKAVALLQIRRMLAVPLAAVLPWAALAQILTICAVGALAGWTMHFILPLPLASRAVLAALTCGLVIVVLGVLSGLLGRRHLREALRSLKRQRKQPCVASQES